jgi:hypothetical protein
MRLKKLVKHGNLDQSAQPQIVSAKVSTVLLIVNTKVSDS